MRAFRLWLVLATDVLCGTRELRMRAETRDEALHQAQALAPRWKGGFWEVSELHGPVTCCRGIRDGQLRWCTPECCCPKCLADYEAGMPPDERSCS